MSSSLSALQSLFLGSGVNCIQLIERQVSHHGKHDRKSSLPDQHPGLHTLKHDSLLPIGSTASLLGFWGYKRTPEKLLLDSSRSLSMSEPPHSSNSCASRTSRTQTPRDYTAQDAPLLADHISVTTRLRNSAEWKCTQRLGNAI